MDMTDNTILITGGNAGIGRALAEQFHARGNRVIIAGRRQEALDEVVAANPGIEALQFDISDAAAIAPFAAQVAERFPALNVLINNAGIMRDEDLLAEPFDLADAEATIATNLLGPIRLTAALLPHLRRQQNATIVNVSSGLAFVTLARTPTYSATKAALHAYSEALRAQLRDTGVQVIELIPPAVATDLQPTSRDNPNAMPLDEYIAESMSLFEQHPDADEIAVERVKMLRFARERGSYDQVFGRVNGVH